MFKENRLEEISSIINRVCTLRYYRLRASWGLVSNSESRKLNKDYDKVAQPRFEKACRWAATNYEAWQAQLERKRKKICLREAKTSALSLAKSELNYAKMLLTSGTHLRKEDIPEDLAEAKVVQLKLRRKLNENRKRTSHSTG